MSPGSGPREGLEAVANALADRTAVDWKREHSESADDGGLIRALQVISHMSRISDAVRVETPVLDPLPDGTVVPTSWGTIRLESAIGHGAFGTVFRAKDLLLDHTVALKVLHPGPGPLVGRLIEEGRRLARLRHPNIVNVICIDQHEDLIGLRMELLQGTTLGEHVREHGVLGEREVIEAGLQLARALSAAHAAGIIHRDVKAHNVIRENDGRIVLMDLGAGADYDVDDPDGTKGVIGTPMYLAPEVLEGGSASPRSDIYSLGVLLYHVASGEYPVMAETLPALRAALAAGQSMPLRDRCPDLSLGLLDVVERAMHADPKLRFSTAEQVIHALSALTASRDEPESQTAPRHNLPVLLTRFVGRENLLEDGRDWVTEQRLVTFTGAGGCGKTRTALELGWKLVDAFEDGIRLVELASVARGELVPQAILEACDIKATPAVSPVESLLAGLRDKHVLVILDNCEHLTRACAEIASALLSGTPGVHLLATSREAFRVPGEWVHPIAPLAVPEPGDEQTPEQLRGVESVTLFEERARSADARFEITDDRAEAVARICHRLDGIPLAIELAAVQVAVFPLPEIARRLEDRFLALGEGVKTGLPHHQTLQTLIGWSYELLSRAERVLLRRASIFAGGWTIESAESVCAGDEVEPSDMPSLHFQLVSKSLVMLDPEVEPGTGNARYRVLETIREFSRSRLEAEDDPARVRHRHRERFLAMRKEAEQRARTKMVAGWHDRIRVDLDNYRAAVRTCMEESTDSTDAVALATTLERYWRDVGHWVEADGLFDELLTRPDLQGRTRLRGKVLLLKGTIAQRTADHASGMRILEESVSIFRELEDVGHLAEAVNMLGSMYYTRKEYEKARDLMNDALDMARQVGNMGSFGSTLANLAGVHTELGEFDRSAALLRECLELQREAGNRQGVAHALANLAVVTVNMGDPKKGQALFEEALAIRRELGEPWAVAMVLANLAHVCRLNGDTERARELYAESLPMLRELGATANLITAIEGYAGVEVALGAPRRAATLIGAAEAMHEKAELPLSETNRRSLESTWSMVVAALGPQEIAALRTEGRQLGVEKAIALALSRDETDPT